MKKQMDKNNKELEPMQLWTLIRDNIKLRSLEIGGFSRGQKRGKKMNIPQIETILKIQVKKQMVDCCLALDLGTKDDLMRALADVRNNAGLLFLVLDGQKFENWKVYSNKGELETGSE